MLSRTGRGAEITLLFTAFIASTYGFGMYLFPAMSEAIRADLPFSYGTMGTISGAVQVGFMACALLAGLLTLRFGAIPMILGSIVICALALGGLAVAPDVTTMAVFLTILGGAAAAIWVPMVEVSREIIPEKHQGKALGLMSSGTSYGVFINSVLLTTSLTTYGWRSLWTVTCALVTVLAVIGFLRLRGIGAPGASGGVGSVEKPSVRERLRTMPKGLCGAILFMMFLNGLSCMPFQTYLSAFLQSEAGHSTEVAAGIWRIIAVVGMVGGFAVGALADRITIRLAMAATYAILALACLALVNGGGEEQTIGLYVAAVAFGIAFYAIFGLVPAYIGHAFGPGNAALVFAFGNIALGTGGTAGNILGGVLKELTGSFVPIYMIMLGAALFSAGLSLAMPDERSFKGKTGATVAKYRDAPA